MMISALPSRCRFADFLFFAWPRTKPRHDRHRVLARRHLLAPAVSSRCRGVQRLSWSVDSIALDF